MICDLLDGKLSGSERGAAFRRIDADEALYEVFVETVRWRASQAAEVSDASEGAGSVERKRC